ncbi:MAG: hypothetical protein CR974_00035 [Gammaproteobacteria bacterium]|nr:MAG: hypothetical protein CR974_00035 [Gammaproteobacteria bacterium]
MLKQLFSGSAKRAGEVASLYKISTLKAHNWSWRIGLAAVTVIVLNIIFMFFWSSEPEAVRPQTAMQQYLDEEQIYTKDKQVKTGVALTATTVHMIDNLLDKRGGYLSNDVLSPGVLMDNMPSWEYGVLRNLRDTATVFRNNFSTAGASQTKLDKDLSSVENLLRIDSTKWMMPQAEESYRDAGLALKRYLDRIVDDGNKESQFYARADNLRRFLRVVSPNLGSYSQRLAESVGTKSENLALAGDANAQQSTHAPKQVFEKTPWHEVDNNFYEARGYAWALLQEMRAIKVDFKAVLADKNATAYVDQLIRELEATQSTVWSPVILNGGGFGVVANHSQVMASYLSRANAILIELSSLLEKG